MGLEVTAGAFGDESWGFVTRSGGVAQTRRKGTGLAGWSLGSLASRLPTEKGDAGREQP